MRGSAQVDRSSGKLGSAAADSISPAKDAGCTGSPLRSVSRAPGVSPGREIALTLSGIAVTIVAAVGLATEVLDIASVGGPGTIVEQAVFAGVVAGLIFGNLAYQVSRAGYMLRLLRHRAVLRRPAGRGWSPGSAPRVTILIPSYKEQARVIRQALWSAALQRYPGKRVVLLIDDPPIAVDAGDAELLQAARRLPLAVQEALAEPAALARRTLGMILERRRGGRCENDALRRLCLELAAWYEQRANEHPIGDHTDRLFARLTFLDPAAELRARARDLGGRGPLGRRRLLRECRALAATFETTLSSFERKRYATLSHQPSKAMNLNGYISLLGKRMHEVERDGRKWLVEAGRVQEAIQFPDADYLITLDADSLLAPDYAALLVRIMERPGNERVAVAQTPYSAVPGPSGALERVAGATTDVQYIVHQGFTRFGATFWVGANAVLRTAALRDICSERDEGGIRVRRYVSDRTVIEDTESSLDLVARGWRLYNHPERASFSATPPDFGSLVVQRRRWANGGLLLLPKLLPRSIDTLACIRTLPEALLRAYYLTSIAVVSAGVPVLLLYPFEDNLRSLWLPLTALPYFLLYWRDMMQSGYRSADLLRVYALNLMLIPVHLAGVCQSLRQALTGRRVPFKRTPKIGDVTAAPARYVLAERLLLGWCAANAAIDLLAGRWFHAAFALVNAGFFAYALAVLVRSPRASERRSALGPWPPAADRWSPPRASR